METLDADDEVELWYPGEVYCFDTGDAYRVCTSRIVNDFLERYDADWLLVDRQRRFPEALVASLGPGFYDDGRFVLLRLLSE